MSQSGHNSGTAEDKRAALASIGIFATSLLTLATAILALSATFLKDLYHGQALGLLIASWIFLTASLVAGTVTLGQQISLLAESDLRPRRSIIELYGLVHFILVLVGLVLFVIFAGINVACAPAK